MPLRASSGMIYISSFMKISRHAQAVLRFCLNNLRGCSVGIMGGIYEIGSGTMMYILSLIKVGSGTEKLLQWGIHIQTDLISLLLFFLNRENRLKIFSRDKLCLRAEGRHFEQLL
jgi:hypothetical protein